MKEILITSSVLIAVLLVLRVIFAKKVSRVLIYSAWGLVALRLLIPVQIGQLDFSILTSAKPMTEAITQIEQRPVSGQTKEEVYQDIVADYIEKDQTVFIPEVQEQIKQEISQGTVSREEILDKIQQARPNQEIFVPEVQQQVQQQVEETAEPITLGQIATIVWLFGVAVMAVWFAVVNLRHSRMLRKNREKLDCDSPIPVYVSEKVGSPCLAGLFRPAIYLTPECAASEETRRHVLTHELTHYRHMDHIWSVVRCVCLCVYWFDPLVWVAAWFSRRDCELACDEGALKRLGPEERIAYGRSLLDVVSHASTPANLMQTATAMNETKKQLKERVSFIVKKPKISLIAAICMVIACAIVAGCAAAGPANMATNPSTPDTTTQPTTTNPTTSDPAESNPPKVPTKEIYVLTQIYHKQSGTGSYVSAMCYDTQGNLLSGVTAGGTRTYSKKTVTIDRENRIYIAVYQTVGNQYPSPLDKEIYRATYDAENRMLTYERINGYDELLYAEAYSYNAQGQLEKKIVARYDYKTNGDCSCEGSEYIYTYNTQGQIQTEAVYNYWIHANGEEFRPEEPNQIVGYSYDEYGKLIRKEHRSYFGSLEYYSTFAYDAEARTVTETRCIEGGYVNETITVYYDPDGRPVRRVSDDWDGDTYVETTDYYYQKLQVPADTFQLTGIFDIPDTIQPFWQAGGQDTGAMRESDRQLYTQAVTALESYGATGQITFQDDIRGYEGEVALWAIYALFNRLGDYQQSPQYMQEVLVILQNLKKPGEPEPPEPQKVTYTVKAVDTRGNPVAGVPIIMYADSENAVRTDENGIFQWEDYEVETPFYPLLKQMPDGYAYSGYTQEGNVYTILMRPIVTYTVKVVDENGKPLVNADVWMSGSVGSNSTSADSNGIATFSLPEDRYEVKVTNFYARDGEEIWTQRYEIAEGQTEATFTWVDDTVSYKVRVVDVSGNPVAGVWVSPGVKDMDGVIPAMLTDENGVAEFHIRMRKYYVYIYSEAYIDGEYCILEYGEFETPEGKTEVTIVVGEPTKVEKP